MRGRSVLAETIAGAGEVAALGEELATLEHKMASRANDLERTVDRFGEVQARYQELGGYEIEARAHTILAGLGLHADQVADDVGKLSGGWKMRVALAQILLLAPDALLLDEPTNYLDIESILWLEGFLRDYPGAVVMTCHDRDVMNRVVQQDRRDRRRPGAQLHRRLRLLRAGARPRRRAARGRVRAPAGDAGQGDALRRSLPRAGGQGVAGAEPHQEAREDRAHRAAAPPGRARLRVSPRRRAPGDDVIKVEGVCKAYGAQARARRTRSCWCAAASAGR